MGEGEQQWTDAPAVAIGRVEEGIKGLKETLGVMADNQKSQRDTLTRHEVAIRVLESRQQPRIHWVTVLGVVIAIVVSAVALLDRLFTP